MITLVECTWNHVSMSYRLRDPSFLVNVAWAIFEKQFFFFRSKSDPKAIPSRSLRIVQFHLR